MNNQIEIETDRLLLRRWRNSDLEPFIYMNNSPEVMRYFPGVLTAGETTQFHQRILQEFAQYGYGLYAAEEKRSGSFMGFIGFHRANMDVAFCPCIEIGWRLDRRFWDRGYATEGAKACLEHGFQKLGFERVYSFTAIRNKPSQRVMQKIGLEFERYFDHPNLPKGDPLRPHVCYYREKRTT